MNVASNHRSAVQPNSGRCNTSHQELQWILKDDMIQRQVTAKGRSERPWLAAPASTADTLAIVRHRGRNVGIRDQRHIANIHSSGWFGRHH